MTNTNAASVKSDVKNCSMSRHATVAAISFVAAIAGISLACAFAELPRPSFLFVIAGALLVAAIVTPAVHALVVVPLRRMPVPSAISIDTATPKVVAPVPTAAAASVLTDPYTGLPDRRAITTALLETMAHAERYGDPFSIAMFTLDLPGSNVDWNRRGAARMATVFAETLRMPDKAGHYSDRAFLVLFPHTKLADAGRIIERIRAEALNHEVEYEGQRVPLKVVIGAAQFHMGDDLTQLLSRAEQGSAAALVA